MIEYTINSSDFGPAYKKLNVLSEDREAYMPGDPDDKNVVITFYYEGDDEFFSGEELVIRHSLQIHDVYTSGYYERVIERKLPVVFSDYTDKTVCVVYNNVDNVDVYDFLTYKDGNGVVWWVFPLGDKCSFGESVYEFGGVTINVSFPAYSQSKNPKFSGFFVFNTPSSIRCMENDLVFENGVTPYDFLDTVYTYQYKKIDNPSNDVKTHSHYISEFPNPVLSSDYEYVKTFSGEEFEYYQKTVSRTNINNIQVTSDSILFSSDDDYVVMLPNVAASVTIPISFVDGGNPCHEDIVRDVFVQSEVDKSVNGIVDMEKNIYYPVKKNQGEQNEDVKRIKFNMHFRQHRGENWLVEDDEHTLWNGTYWDDDDGIWKFYNTVQQNYTNQYFSYGDKSKQSDLLMFLGFDNSDVRFRKQSLSKSFLRLSFFDSVNTGVQNLLGYSTVFVDSGKLFRKMSEYSSVYDTGGGIFTIINPFDSDIVNTGDIHRIQVCTEPAYSVSDDSKRLSSQLVIDERGVASKTSEGFCVYLWKEQGEGVIPVNIYMKAEFYNAKYGRKFPMMAPYKDDLSGFKTFEDIVNDWNYNGGYGIRKYNDYSYIRMKYVYDIGKNKHVYYLDSDLYGSDGYEGDEMVINLYEAKVKF